MQTTVITANNSQDFVIPLLDSFVSTDINAISHSVTHNIFPDMARKRGTYNLCINFAHDDYAQTIRKADGSEVSRTGGIDMRLTSFADCHRNGEGLKRYRAAIERNHREAVSRRLETTWYEETKAHFVEVAHSYKDTVRSKLPEFYTGILRHQKTRRVIMRAMYLVIDTGISKFVHARIGECIYSFEMNFQVVQTKSGEMSKCHYSIMPIDINSPDDGDFSFEDELAKVTVGSGLMMDHETELPTQDVRVPRRVPVSSEIVVRLDRDNPVLAQEADRWCFIPERPPSYVTSSVSVSAEDMATIERMCADL